MDWHLVEITKLKKESQLVYNDYVFYGKVVETGEKGQFRIRQSVRYRPDGDLMRLKKGDQICVKGTFSVRKPGHFLAFSWHSQDAEENMKEYVAPPVRSKYEDLFIGIHGVVR